MQLPRRLCGSGPCLPDSLKTHFSTWRVVWGLFTSALATHSEQQVPSVCFCPLTTQAVFEPQRTWQRVSDPARGEVRNPHPHSRHPSAVKPLVPLKQSKLEC